MKTILTSSILILCFFCVCKSQNLVGIYTDKTNAKKEIDSLYLNSDSTYRYAFYFPKYGVSEYYFGRWTYVGSDVILYYTGDYTGTTHIAFILLSSMNNGTVTQLKVTKAQSLKKKKGQIVLRN